MTLAIFSFESSQVRTLGTAEAPLFVAIDIATALGYQNSKDALSRHVDPEDITKQEIETKGGRQTVNCVNESGLYALIFGSKLESAKRFKRWVTNEVLPAIRKQGRYECPAQAHLPPPTLTEQQAHTIMSKVAMRARRDGAKYQTIYRALKERYQVTKYTHIPRDKFEDAIEFIRTVELRTPVVTGNQPEAPMVQNRNITASTEFCETLRRFVWYQRYVYAECHHKFHKYLQLVDSPLAGRYYDMYTSINLANLERQLAKIGFPVSDLECYKRTHGLDDIVAR